MDCKRHETALREHALGESLSPALETHLASCDRCREKLAGGRGLRAAIDTALDHLRQIEPSPAFLDRARTAARDASFATLRPGRLDRLAWSPVLAVVVLASALGVILVHDRRLPGPTPPTLTASPRAPARPSVPERPTAASRPGAVSQPDSPRRARSSENRLAVLVPAGQEEAIIRLARLVATGAVAPPASLVDPPDPSQPLTPPAKLSLPPLAIEPLSPAAAESEGVMP